MPDDPRNIVGRRSFLSSAGVAGAAFAGMQLLPGSIRKALAVPASRVTGTIRDVQHVVILMQENRSFDHYFGSLAGVRGFGDRTTIRFLEARFGVQEPNITPWHRAVCGDLTSCFDFAHPNDAELPELPDMSAATGETLVIEGLPPVSVPEPQQLPEQAPGVRYARALPYALHAHMQENASAGRIDVSLHNVGRAGAVFHVYDRLHLDLFPRRYTVEAGKGLTDAWVTSELGDYDLLIIGPNGFLREFTGALGDAEPAPEVELEYHPRRRELELKAWNDGSAFAVIDMTPEGYRSQRPFSLQLPCDGGVVCRAWSVARSGDWYDFSVRCEARPSWRRRFAGRMETGRHGVSDPAQRRR